MTVVNWIQLGAPVVTLAALVFTIWCSKGTYYHSARSLRATARNYRAITYRDFEKEALECERLADEYERKSKWFWQR